MARTVQNRKQGRLRASSKSPESRKRQLRGSQHSNLETTLDIDSDPDTTPLHSGNQMEVVKLESESDSAQDHAMSKRQKRSEGSYRSSATVTDSVRSRPFHDRQLLLTHIVEKHVAARSERIQAVGIFERITSYCDDYEVSHDLPPKRNYKRSKLLKQVYDCAVSDVGRDSVLEYSLRSLASPGSSLDPPKKYSLVLAELARFDDKTPIAKKEILQRFQQLTDHLVDDFFLPLRASSAQTPKPRPRLSHKPQGTDDTLTQTANRLFSLREDCLRRDRHRCIISRVFDEAEADYRFETAGVRAKDDEGKSLKTEETGYLEVAHIIPHSLALSEEFSDKTRSALSILNLFDPGIVDSIEGPSIDRVYNALSLCHDYRRRFGNLKVYFEAVPKSRHQYIVKFAESSRKVQPDPLITVDFTSALHNNMDPPMPRLLAIHRACCRILKGSDVGGYLDKVVAGMME